MFYLLKNCKKREILRVILGGFWKLCFDPQKGATNKDRRRVQAYGGLPLCDPRGSVYFVHKGIDVTLAIKCEDGIEK